MFVFAHASACARRWIVSAAVSLFWAAPLGAVSADIEAALPADATRVESRVQLEQHEAGLSKSGTGRARNSRRVVLDPPPMGLRSELAARTMSGVPLQVGIGREVESLATDESTASAWAWEQLESGPWVAAIGITSPSAASLRAALRISALPDAATVRFYGPDGGEHFEISGHEINSTIQRNLTAGGNGTEARLYWSPIIDGDTILVEIQLPDGAHLRSLRVAIPGVSHLVTSAAEKFVIESGACNVDATCSQATWGNAMNSVARMLYSASGGTYLCTGTLLADQGNTGTPYFLTANHCISTQTSASSLTTYWFYRSGSCNSGVLSPNWRQLSGGGVLLYNSSATDTTFLRLNNQPPAGTVFSGWYVAGVAGVGSSVTGLHHPGGDLLKVSGGSISGYWTCTPPTNNSFSCSGASAAAATYYNVRFTSGTTEPGSSGSGIFLDSGQYLVGQLYGGSSSCTNPSGANYYGRFDVAYNAGIRNWLAAATATLTVAKAGTGSGTVASSPQGISCGATCSANFTSGSVVTLSASSAQGSTFAGWSGAGCTGTGTCAVTMNAATSVTATFNATNVTTTLTVLKAGTGTGTVTSSPAGINCGAVCSASFTTGTSITLIASAAAGSIFTGWSGICSGTGSCTVALNAATSVRATFTAGPSHTLTVTNAGAGTGSVVFSSPEGLSCSATCSSSYAAGTAITLTAVPVVGSAFTGWSGGGCSGTVACTVTLTADTTVTATFDRAALRANLTVVRSGIGTGTVVSSPPGIDCGATCLADFPADSRVELTPTPGPGSVFTGWTGICSGLGSCIVSMSSSISVKATFTTSTSTFPLTVTTSGIGFGTVTSSPGGISCPSACQVDYSTGTAITLTAAPSAGSVFVGWSGACSGTGSCNVTMTAARSVTATFTSVTSVFPLTVTTTGTGSGLVTSSPAGISCPTACAADFASGTLVTLTASPSSGSSFAGWSGACSGTAPCTLTLSAAATVSASFTTNPAPGPASLSTRAVAFGGASMGTMSPPLTVTVTNSGALPISISGVSSSESQFTVAANNNCASLGATQSCSIFIWFNPRAIVGPVGSTANVTGLLTIATNATGGPYTVSLSGTAEKSLVTQFYGTILNRKPDAGGKAYWDAEALRLYNLGADINEVWYVLAGNFFNSAEYLQAGKSDAQFVTDLYNTFFSRSPDEAGMSFWTGQIAAGLPRDVAMLSFMFSSEFRNFTNGIFGAAPARPEVNLTMDMFRGVLNRLPDNAGYSYWVLSMRAAQCAGANAVYAEMNRASSLFIYSPEYAGRGRNDTQFVGDMYNAFLRRGGDLSGVQFWVNQLASGARTREALRQAFIASPELGARVEAVIAAGCVQ